MEKARTWDQKQAAEPPARGLLLALADRMPFGERGERLAIEFFRVQTAKGPWDDPALPNCCYKIFAKLHKTVFASIPLLDEIVYCPDPSKLTRVKSWEEAKKYIRFDWYRLGKVIGIPIRGVRFFEQELDTDLQKHGLSELNARELVFVRRVIGKKWLKEKLLWAETISEAIAPDSGKSAAAYYMDGERSWEKVAYQWGIEAMSEFKRGIADGIKDLLDENGELKGASTAFHNYAFFMILWPEINDFLSRDLMPTRTEVFKWIQPFHSAGLVNFPTIEYFRNFCESIELKFIGRTPNKGGMP
jgi:hypothetical protein